MLGGVGGRLMELGTGWTHTMLGGGDYGTENWRIYHMTPLGLTWA